MQTTSVPPHPASDDPDSTERARTLLTDVESGRDPHIGEDATADLQRIGAPQRAQERLCICGGTLAEHEHIAEQVSGRFVLGCWKTGCRGYEFSPEKTAELMTQGLLTRDDLQPLFDREMGRLEMLEHVASPTHVRAAQLSLVLAVYRRLVRAGGG